MFATNVSGTIGHPYAKLYTFCKINSKLHHRLIYVKHKIIKLLQDNIERSLDKFGDELLNTPKVWFMKEKVDTLDFIKIKNVSFEKDTIKRIKRQVTDQEEIFKKHIFVKGLVFKL